MSKRISRSEEAAAMAAVITELLDVSRALVGIAVYSVNAAPVDISVTQYRLLAVVASAGPRTIGEVATLLGVAQSNASRHCDRLERLELLRRTRSPEDGRVVLVHLTDSGRQVVDFVTTVREREIGKVVEQMSVRDSQAALAAVRAFNSAAAGLEAHPWLTAVW